MAAPDPTALADLARRIGEAIAAPGATAADVAAVAGGPVADDGAPLGVRAEAELAGVASVGVTRRWDSEEPNAADIQLEGTVELAPLEERLGPSRPLPPGKPGDRRVILDGEDDRWTVLAALDGDGAVQGLTVRRDT